jgi:hypothetical protein
VTSEGVQFIGPFEQYDVVINGRRVPYLTAQPENGGVIALSLDRRFALELPVSDADRIVAFIADCIAVASGYTAHPGEDGIPEPIHRHPFPKMVSIDDFEVGS